jgi:hypothetical protein
VTGLIWGLGSEAATARKVAGKSLVWQGFGNFGALFFDASKYFFNSGKPLAA